MKMSDKEKEEKDITEQLGPITEFHMMMRLPQTLHYGVKLLQELWDIVN